MLVGWSDSRLPVTQPMVRFLQGQAARAEARGSSGTHASVKCSKGLGPAAASIMGQYSYYADRLSANRLRRCYEIAPPLSRVVTGAVHDGVWPGSLDCENAVETAVPQIA